jgi:hypothetical protein
METKKRCGDFGRRIGAATIVIGDLSERTDAVSSILRGNFLLSVHLRT